MADGASVSPKQVELLINFVPILGRGGGQYLNLVYNREQFTEVVGVDGEGYYVVVPDLSGRCTVALLQTSKSNDYLSRLWRAQIAATGNLLWPVTMRDRGGNTLFSCKGAVITKLPDTGFSDAGELRVWTIASTRWEGFVGGNDATPLGQNIDA